MTTRTKTTTHSSVQWKTAAWAAIFGVALILAGVVSGAIAGAELDKGLVEDSFGEYLTNVAANIGWAQTHVWFILFGATLLSLGGLLLSRLGDQDSPAAAIAPFFFTAGAAATIVFFPITLGVIVELAPRHVAGDNVETVARALALAATTADWLATVLIVSFGAVAVAVAGKTSWVPRWLYRWALVAGVAGVISIIGTVTGAFDTVSIIVLPPGVSWMVAAGIVALKKSNSMTLEGSNV